MIVASSEIRNFSSFLVRISSSFLNLCVKQQLVEKRALGIDRVLKEQNTSGGKTQNNYRPRFVLFPFLYLVEVYVVARLLFVCLERTQLRGGKIPNHV